MTTTTTTTTSKQKSSRSRGETRQRFEPETLTARWKRKSRRRTRRLGAESAMMRETGTTRGNCERVRGAGNAGRHDGVARCRRFRRRCNSGGVKCLLRTARGQSINLEPLQARRQHFVSHGNNFARFRAQRLRQHGIMPNHCWQTTRWQRVGKFQNARDTIHREIG